MSDWAEGYITEVGYIHRYHPHLLPRLLAFAALSRGVAAPGGGSEKIRVLELGCGQGVSANIIAAVNPNIDYTALDFNPSHISGARALAAAAGTPNLRFVEASFEDMADERSWGCFDIILLHGIYSWVSATNREHIVRIAREKLRAGGMLYLSYNTYPGWATIAPIRRMFVDIAQDNPSAPIFDQLDHGFGVFDRLHQLKSRYIEAIPNLVNRIEQLKTHDRRYIAHEYLNKEWKIFHFSDVVKDMARAKLSYVGSANLLDHLDGINLTDEQREFLATIRNPIRRESVRDLIVNQSFRRDIFLKGVIPMSEARIQNGWADLRFALSTNAASVPRDAQGVQFHGTHRIVHERVLEKLDSGPRTTSELLQEPEISSQSGAFRQVMVYLVGQGNCHVVPAESNEDERIRRAEALNGVILNDARDWNVLASPVLGGAVEVNDIAQLMLLAVREKSADPAGFIWNILRSQNKKLVKDGKPLDSEEENVAELHRKVIETQTDKGRVLAKLKVC